MYFIVTGTVEIRTPSKELVAGLAAGQSFGETVLLEGAPDKWKKHVYCQNMVCLAILKKAKFLKVAANYPFLKEKISLYVKRLKEERARANGHNQGIYGNDLSSIKKLESS